MRARVFRVWEMEHGRRIQGSDVSSKRSRKGLKERLHGLF
jgi:hypothetical protein